VLSFVLGEKPALGEKVEFINQKNYQSFIAERANSSDSNPETLKIGIVSDYTLQPIIQSISVAERVLNYNFEVIRFPIETVHQQLINRSSSLYSAKIDLLILYPDYSKLVIEEGVPDRESQVITEVTRLKDLIERFHYSTKCKVILTSAPLDRKESANNLYKVINNQLRSNPQNFLSILRLDFSDFKDTNWFDSRLLEHFRIPFAPNNISIFVGSLVNSLRSSLGCPIKMIITDLDGTLWEPILAEEEPTEFRSHLENLEKSNLEFAFQLRDQFEKGLTLAIATKNDRKRVDEILKDLKNFPLELRNFYRIEANWNRKSESIKRILSAIGFQPRNVLFIDDSPLECIEVKTCIPDLQVFHVESQHLLCATDFYQVGLFAEEVILTKEDSLRNKSYEVTNWISEIDDASQLRIFLNELRQLPSLELTQPSDYSRLNQMHDRTNQFRANPRHFSPAMNSRVKQAALKLKDRHLDYGIVGYLEWEVKTHAVEVRQWLMSCRVFNRDLDIFMLREILILEKLPSETPFQILFEDSGKNSFLFDTLFDLGFVQKDRYFYGELTNGYEL
jgi:FkbH-like protein